MDSNEFYARMKEIQEYKFYGFYSFKESIRKAIDTITIFCGGRATAEQLGDYIIIAGFTQEEFNYGTSE